MIKQELFYINNKEFIKTYSDRNHYILQVETGVEYVVAEDIVPCKYTYIETERMIVDDRHNE